jgi:class 3 adenylate cyclase/tetratricopeptide (TPR) repeat protein
LTALQPKPASQASARAVGERRAERRPVTALFCDIVGSVALTQRLGAEDMMHVVDVFFATCDRVIAEHGGYIVNYMGDGVLAYFGYPSAHEDDAANAVRAGMALGRAVAALDLDLDIALQTRTGIATGQVVVSQLLGPASARREADIVGDTPNLAARLQSVADPDGIVVSNATRRLTSGVFAYRSLGSFELKGFDQPIEAFQPIEASELASRFQARAQGKLTPLVGRDHELAVLEQGWRDACAGHGRVILLQGEAGIGKSRLVEELRRLAGNAPHEQLHWDCGPNDGDRALHPILEQLMRAARFHRGDSTEERRYKLERLATRFGVAETQRRAMLADLLGAPPESANPIETLTPEQRKELALGTLIDMLVAAARPHPALLVVEDLHWADSTTLDLLDRAIRQAGQLHWLIVLTARPEFEPLWPEAAVTPLPLGRLDLGKTEQICAHLGADRVLPSSLLGQIIARCDGVPLFVEELTKSVIEAMAAEIANDTAMIAIPESLQESLIARLDRLGPARRIANLGAAIGRRFSYELIAAVASEPEAALRQNLRALTLSGLVECQGLPPDSTYLFKHALIRDAAYESMVKRARQHLHGQIAAALQSRFPETSKTAPELVAYHLTESGAAAEAIPLWAAAGRRAAARAGHADAARHWQTALDLLRGGPAQPALELELLLGLAFSRSASLGPAAPETGQALRKARALCDQLGDIDQLFAVLRGLGNFALVSCAQEEAEETSRRCVEIGEQTGRPEHRIEGALQLGYVLWARGDLAEAELHLERLARLYADHDSGTLMYSAPQDPLVSGLGALGLLRHAKGDRDGAERAFAEQEAHARAGGRPFDLAYALSWNARYSLIIRDYPAALRFAEESHSLCNSNGYAMYGEITAILCATAQAALECHDPAAVQRAIAVVIDKIAELKQLGTRHGHCYYIGELAGLQAAAGELEAAHATIDAAIAYAEDSGDRYFLSPLHHRRAEILARLPTIETSAIEAALAQAIAVAERQGASSFAQTAARDQGRLTLR